MAKKPKQLSFVEAFQKIDQAEALLLREKLRVAFEAEPRSRHWIRVRGAEFTFTKLEYDQLVLETNRLSELTRQKARSPYESWMFFVRKDTREAFFRDWLDERDELEAREHSWIYIRATLLTQLTEMAVVGLKDVLLAVVCRWLGIGPVPPTKM